MRNDTMQNTQIEYEEKSKQTERKTKHTDVNLENRDTEAQR